MSIKARVIIWLAVISWILYPNIAATQTQRPPNSVDAILTFFYKDPRPERLVGYFDEFRKLPTSRNWQAYPPSVGFFCCGV